MTIFGFEFKWPRTKRSKIKKMLVEIGRLDTRRFLIDGWGWHEYDALKYTHDLIAAGCLDSDLWRLYKIKGSWVLVKLLVKDYRFNKNKVKKYTAKIKSFDRRVAKLCELSKEIKEIKEINDIKI